MESRKTVLMHRLEPEILSEGSGGWQQRKSAELRRLVLEAAIDGLVERGYAGMSTLRVAEAAGIPRATVAHHFPTRLSLVEAVVDYAFYRRMEHFLADFATATVPVENQLEVATDKHWQSTLTREYAAYLELAIAARTDAELGAYFNEAAKRYDRIWSEEMTRSFPQWEEKWQQLQVASDLAMAVHMGLLINRPVLEGDDRLDEVRRVVCRVVEALHAGQFRKPGAL
jgi:AcrR family transcriptional regulator